MSVTKAELKEITEDFVKIRRALQDRDGDTQNIQDTAAIAGQIVAARIIAKGRAKK